MRVLFILERAIMARFLRPNVRNFISTQFRMASDHQMGDLGGGEGKGEGGGAMAKKQVKKEYTQEEMYFKRKEQEQLANLKQHHKEEIDHHKKEIERLQREIDRHKGKIRKLKHDD